ncbi:MAG: hypothetical protein NC338_07780 [Firmicutes bacterium]|nr:hypothetical protein [Bacillota bacterium]MCM1400954.1 hypothetical protein [Bacteroides sp.]
MNFQNIFKALTVAATALLTACSGSSGSSIADELREAEAAVAVGDMEAARSVAKNLLGNENLSHLPASELGRLSIVYMQIADSIDQENSIAQATDLYRRAFDANADSAALFYNDVTPEMYPYVAMLRTLVGHLDNPYNPEADSIDENSMPELPASTDSI